MENQLFSHRLLNNAVHYYLCKYSSKKQKQKCFFIYENNRLHCSLRLLLSIGSSFHFHFLFVVTLFFTIGLFAALVLNKIPIFLHINNGIMIRESHYSRINQACDRMYLRGYGREGAAICKIFPYQYAIKHLQITKPSENKSKKAKPEEDTNKKKISKVKQQMFTYFFCCYSFETKVTTLHMAFLLFCFFFLTVHFIFSFLIRRK